jgi:hypothetical protein
MPELKHVFLNFLVTRLELHETPHGGDTIFTIPTLKIPMWQPHELYSYPEDESN